MFSYLKDMFTNERYKDRWVFITVPNATNELGGGKYIRGFLNDDTFSVTRTMDTGSDNIGLIESAVEKGGSYLSKRADGQEGDTFMNKIGDLIGEKGGGVTSRAFNDVLSYNGSSNNSFDFNMTVIPGISHKLDSRETQFFLNRLIMPKPYDLSTKAVGVNNYSSYIEEFNLLTSAVDTAQRVANAVGMSEKESKMTNGLVHIKIGDNVWLKGMIIVSAPSRETILRDEQGQFLAYDVSISAVPFRLLDAEQFSQMITNSSGIRI